MNPGVVAIAALGLLALVGAPGLADSRDAEVPEPDGYRADNYRAPVPRTLRGARVVTTAEAAVLWKEGRAAFVDVLPRPERPRNLPPGTIWRDAPRFDVPGSVWLPDTGYGKLAEVTERYFADGLARASGGDRARPIVFYCREDCWMSWNAAKRALAMGYLDVVWYPDGTDGWGAAGMPLAPARPEPRLD